MQRNIHATMKLTLHRSTSELQDKTICIVFDVRRAKNSRAQNMVIMSLLQVATYSFDIFCSKNQAMIKFWFLRGNVKFETFPDIIACGLGNVRSRPPFWRHK